MNQRSFTVAAAVLYSCAVVMLLTLTPPSRAAQVIALPDAPFVIPQFTDVITQLYGNSRQGANLKETTLTPRSVSDAQHFVKLHQTGLTGQVLAQPLYVHDVYIEGVGRKSLVIVATAANIIYALDANDLSIVFSRILSDDQPVGPELGNSIVKLCPETYPPHVGVTSTPVIDLGSGTVFVETFNPVTAKQELHALTLRDKFASDKKVIIFPVGEKEDWPKRHRNRAALLLSKGVVYVAFASFICDNPQPYQGWIMGYRATDLMQVAQWRTHNSTPADNGGSSGIWQSGRGLVASDDGDIYFMTGNDQHFTELKNHTGDNNFTDPRLANSFVKLALSGPPSGLTTLGTFSPKNSSNLSAGDTDLGSSGPIMLPGGILVGGGKQGRVYVVDAQTMWSLQNHDGPGGDGFQGFQGFFNNYHSTNKPSCLMAIDGGSSDKYCRTLQTKDLLTPTLCPYPQALPGDFINGCSLPVSCYQYCQAYGPNIHAGFVYWPLSSAEGLLYAMPEKEHVKAFKYNVAARKMEENPGSTSNLIVPDGMPGGVLSISANGSKDGIVWVSMPNQSDATLGIHRGSLVALDAKDLSKLWEDPCIFYFAKFNPPIVADGRVYLATFADPHGAKKPGPLTPDGRCDAPDPWPLDTNPKLSSGTSWIIQYGIHP